MAQQPDPRPSLSPAEWEVMKVFWEHGQLAARDVYARLPEEREWAIKTVKTLLGRLVAKGTLDYVQVGNAYLYSPALAQEDAIREEVQEFSRRVLNAEPQHAAVNFLKHVPLNPRDIQRLRAMLDEAEKKQKESAS